MKLSVGDIKLSKFGCTSTNVGVEIGDPPFLICTMGISVPLVEGKALEQYKEELLAKARERITNIYKEIVCGGELDDEIMFQAKGVGQQSGLKVTVSDKDDVLWMRDGSNQEGIVSLGYLKDGTQQRIIAALEDALFQAKGQVLCLSDDSIKVDFPVMRLSRHEPKSDSIFDFNKHERIGGNVQVKLVSGETAILYYEEDLDLKSTFEGYLSRAKEYARKSIKAH